jgi:hypothetical protein
VVTKNIVFWDIVPCGALKVNRRFGALLATYFHADCFLGFFDSEDGGGVPPKLPLTFNGLHNVISQNTLLFICIITLKYKKRVMSIDVSELCLSPAFTLVASSAYSSTLKMEAVFLRNFR